MDPEGIMPGEISQRERQVLYDLSYMWNLKEKKTPNNQAHRYREQQRGDCQRLGLQRGRNG